MDHFFVACASTATRPELKYALLELFIAGGYPPAVARKSPARRDAWFQSCVMTILLRDILDLANIQGR